MLKRLLKFTGERRIYFILGPLLILSETAAELLMPYFMGRIVDYGVNTGSVDYIIRTGLIMVLVSVCGIAFGTIATRCIAIAAYSFGAALRRALFDKIQNFSFADVDRFSTASLITRATTDVKQLQEVCQEILRTLARAPSMLIVSVILCLRLNVKLTGVYLFAIPALLILVFTIIHFTHHLFLLMENKIDELNDSVQENLVAIRVVKTFVRMRYEKQKFKKSNDELTDTSIYASLRVVVMQPASTLVLNITTIALYWFGGHLVGNGEMLDGQLLSFVSYLNNVMMSVMMFSMVLTRTSRARACAGRYFEVLDHQPDIVGGSDGHTSTLQGAIEFDHVSFRYPQSDRKGMVLDDVSFSIAPGEFVAIVGATGVGKTSLVSLIPRFYDTTQGTVRVDGVDVRDYDLTHLRSSIGMVLQNNVLFSGTIRENLQWGAPDADDDTLIAAAKDAQAWEFISRFPEGLDTRIDQGGVNVSGGQKQRLCIARAMLKNPAILILDDSTSAVDSATEGLIRETFYSKYKDTTVLLVAQRISSVQYADRIIVLDRGRISAIGTHDDLMQSSELYRAIYDSQQEGGVTDE
jgi:ATP-binding cassette subfamily B protein